MRKVIGRFLACLIIACFAFPVRASEEFNIEVGLTAPLQIPAAIISAMKRQYKDLSCFKNAKTTLEASLTSQKIELGGGLEAYLLKPDSDDSNAGLICLCGAYLCPMWIFQLEAGGRAKELWSTSTANLSILDKKTRGVRDLFESGGSAGHMECSSWKWDGRKYKISKEAYVDLSDINANINACVRP
jgi:hypothetical protein